LPLPDIVMHGSIAPIRKPVRKIFICRHVISLRAWLVAVFYG
jgi:hypothetical protein